MTSEQKAMIFTMLDIIEVDWERFCNEYEEREGVPVDEDVFDSIKGTVSDTDEPI